MQPNSDKIKLIIIINIGMSISFHITHSPDLRDSQQKQSHQTKNKHPPPKIQYKGITLKEYFRICDENNCNEPIKEMEQESFCSSKASMAQTPSFSHDKDLKAIRPKIKTQFNEEQVENHCKNNVIKHQIVFQIETNRNKISKIPFDRNQNTHVLRQYPFRRKADHKRINDKTQSKIIKINDDIQNRSTLSSFHQCEENKRKMLKKVVAEKERANDLRLSDAFFITKYGSKFQIDAKQFLK